MTVQAADVLTSVRTTLIDASAVTFSDTELVGYLNEGVRATCFAKPEAYPAQASLTLVAGILQQIPDDGVALLDVIATGGGQMVTQVDKALMEAADPNWPMATPVANIDHYTADPRDPRRWLCYPPAQAGATAVVRYGTTPPVAAVGGSVALPAAYEPILIDYVLSRAYAKNSKKQDTTKEAYHKQQWGAALGLKTQAQVSNSPRIVTGTPT